jgi:hypothetical protein
MKYIMHIHGSRHCKHVCNWPYSIQYFKWTTEYGYQLCTTTQFQRHFLGIHFQKYMLPYFKFSNCPVLVYINFLSILSYF